MKKTGEHYGGKRSKEKIGRKKNQKIEGVKGIKMTERRKEMTGEKCRKDKTKCQKDGKK